jgi:hypothetical protein
MTMGYNHEHPPNWPKCRRCGQPVMVYPFGPRKGQPAKVCEACMLAGLIKFLRDDDALWCPRCGEEFTEADVAAAPKAYWTCPLCGTVEHVACRGPIAPDAEVARMHEQLVDLARRVVRMDDALLNHTHCGAEVMGWIAMAAEIARPIVMEAGDDSA